MHIINKNASSLNTIVKIERNNKTETSLLLTAWNYYTQEHVLIMMPKLEIITLNKQVFIMKPKHEIITLKEHVFIMKPQEDFVRRWQHEVFTVI